MLVLVPYPPLVFLDRLSPSVLVVADRSDFFLEAVFWFFLVATPLLVPVVAVDGGLLGRVGEGATAPLPMDVA